MSKEEEKTEPQTDYMEQEDNKVNVEETTINLSHVKKELVEGEFEFEENRYKIALTFENIFGKSSIELRDNRDSLIGFLDDEVIMETGTIKLEDVKDEGDLIRDIMEQSDCNKCGGNYLGYCRDCSSLSHILNNLTPNIKPEPILNTVPINILEIKEVLTGQAVFALKTIPKGIIMGPFEGVAPIESTTGFQWKIKDKKLANYQNGNWMKYIESVANHASKNLDVVQFDGLLYFETSREIHKGEELLVCYGEETDAVLKLVNEEDFYLVPVKKENYPKVFACSLCCLGFRLEECLMEHKSKCPQGDQDASSKDFVLIQCPCCKVWLEKQEHLNTHMLRCVENHRRLPHRLWTKSGKNDGIQRLDEISTPVIDATIKSEKIPIKISYKIDFKTLRNEHFYETHTRTTRSNTIGEEKTFKCSKCSYQTHYNLNLKSHMNTHTDICKKRLILKDNQKSHIKILHTSAGVKEYTCTQCHYQTSQKNRLNEHINTHSGVKRFQCDICGMKFTKKSNLNGHLKNKHLDTTKKDYKCSECSFQTKYQYNLRAHINTHAAVKPFQCDVCKNKFTQKSHLKVHIRNQHSNSSEKDYKCSECSYQTHQKYQLKLHINTHSGVNSFQCDICEKKFTQKGNLIAHIRNQHSSTNEKKYKCSECFYETNSQYNFKAHLNTRCDVKRFQCDICRKKFTLKGNLKTHIKNKH